MNKFTIIGVAVAGAFMASAGVNFVLALMGGLADFLFLGVVLAIAGGIVAMKDRKIAKLEARLAELEKDAAQLRSANTELGRDMKGTLAGIGRLGFPTRARG